MTCIVGLKTPTRLYMGADSLFTSGDSAFYNKESKVFGRDGYLIGVTGSLRVSQILQFHKDSLVSPLGIPQKDLFGFLCSEFIPLLIETLDKSHYLSSEDGLRKMDGIILLGTHGRLFTIWQNFQVMEYPEEFSVVGSGQYEAQGSLMTTKKYDIPPKERIRLAIKAAIHYNATVGGDIVIKSIPVKKERN